MKIDGPSKPVNGSGVANVGGSATARSTGTAARPNTPQTAGNQGESVQLSPLSSQLQAIENSMASTPVVDSARVAQIWQAISEGRFKVNPDVVADSLLKTARELLQSRLT